MDQAKAYKEFKTNGKLKVLDYELDENDLIVETHEASDYASISDSKITVVLDTNLTEELIDEGYVREVVSKIQTERKEAG
jgi:isoleucyl-tRNA synthetase